MTRSGAGLAMALAAAGAAGLLLGAGPAQRPAYRIGADEIAVTARDYRPVVSFQTASNEVEVEVRVLADGHSVGGLTRSDFRLLDDGAPQAITGFARIEQPGVAAAAPADTGAASAAARPVCPPLATPRTAVMYFDDVDTAANHLAEAREKALAYLDAAQCGGRLPTGERVGVVTGSGYGDLALTGSEAAVRKALRGLAPHPHSSAASTCPLISPYQAWAIVHLPQGNDADELAIAQAEKCLACMPRDCPTYVHSRSEEIWGEAESASDQILQLLQNAVALLARQPGRRTLVVTSSGFLTQQLDLQQRQQRVIDAAIRAGVVIDTLDARGLTAPSAPSGAWNDPWISPQINGWRTTADAGGFSAGDDAMADLAHSTGGEFLADSNDFRASYARDVAGPEIYYRLSFSRPKLKADGAFHKINVAVTAPGSHQIEARRGYFAPAPAPDAPSAAMQQVLLQTVMGTAIVRQLDAVLEASRITGGIHVRVRLNPHSLQLRRGGGRNRDQLQVVLALLTTHGGYVTGRSAGLDLRLTDRTLRHLSQPGVGLNVGADLRAPAGPYRLRVVVLEPATGAVAALGGPVILRR
ncbi:MAG: VWA domain-containing protein [Terriglobales bacterium]